MRSFRDERFDRTMTAAKHVFALVLTVIALNGLLLPSCASINQHTRFIPEPCDDTGCSVTLVESIPENLTFPDGSISQKSTFDSWIDIINRANNSIDIASYYWSLQSADTGRYEPSAWQGEAILESLILAASTRNIRVRIVSNYKYPMERNLVDLQAAGAEVRMINFEELLNAGILHTKFWVVDSLHTYIGSANTDWRSLTQVKELGAVVTDCPCLVSDAQKIFDVYWYMGVPGTPIPNPWPEEYGTDYNIETPMKVRLNTTLSMVYMTSEPQQFCPPGRSNDLDAILDIFDKANEFIYIAVMNYQPLIIYQNPRLFWPVIDDALRKVTIERGIKVRLLASNWEHTHPDMIRLLRSLDDIDGVLSADIQVNMFEVPADENQAQIPYSRVNHDKFIVTDNVVYIGNSNWSGDYFTATSGVAIVINQTLAEQQPRQELNGRPRLSVEASVRQQMVDIFNRDWFSVYSRPISDF